LWINLGPLLYHWASTPHRAADDEDDDMDERYKRSVELSWEEVRHVMLTYNFQLEREETRTCVYSCDQRSMMRTVYECMFFTARKPVDVSQ
jgi:carnosine N-methyltransferase